MITPIPDIPPTSANFSEFLVELNDRLKTASDNFMELSQAAGSGPASRTYNSPATPRYAPPAGQYVSVYDFLDPLYGQLRIADMQVREIALLPNSVGQNQLQIDSVIARHIVAGTITADKLSVNTLSAITANLGTITAGNITLDTSGYIRGGATAYDTGTGFWMGYDTSAYKLFIGAAAGDKLLWNGSSLSITGSLTASTGAIGGFNIGADYIRDAANSMGLASTVTGSDDVRFWAGDTFANRASAPFRVTEAGNITANNATIIGTISGRSTATIAATINSSGNVVTDLINARLDSSAKTMLSDFTFGTSDYAGALKAGTITWNTTTGALTGGTGVLVFRGGIIGAIAGVASFTLDASTGAATFAGALSAATGTFAGSLSAATGTFAGSLSAATGTFAGSLSAATGTFAGSLSAATGSFSGSITSTSGTIGGWTLGATSLSGTDAVLSSTGVLTLGTSNDVVIASSADATYRLWIGHATAASAPFSVSKAGALVASSATIAGTISGRSTVTVAGAIDSSGNFVNDIVNARLNSSAKTMLSDFSFGTSDYAGALKSGTITWNTTTGALTGGTGVLVFRGGIIGANAGAATFTLDAATGNATFSGSVTSTSGTIGGWTLGTTSLSGGNATLSSTGVLTLGTSNDVVISSASDGTYRLWVGHATAGSAPFRVTKAGAVTATNATLTGTITSTSGTIGGFTIGATTLTAGSGDNAININSAGSMVLGNNTLGANDATAILSGSIEVIGYSPNYFALLSGLSGKLTMGSWSYAGSYTYSTNIELNGTDGTSYFLGNMLIKNGSGTTKITLDNSGFINVATSYKVGSTQVVGAQQAAIADVALSGVYGTDSGNIETAINDILGAMRTHGLIAT